MIEYLRKRLEELKQAEAEALHQLGAARGARGEIEQMIRDEEAKQRRDSVERADAQPKGKR